MGNKDALIKSIKSYKDLLIVSSTELDALKKSATTASNIITIEHNELKNLKNNNASRYKMKKQYEIWFSTKDEHDRILEFIHAAEYDIEKIKRIIQTKEKRLSDNY